MAPEDLGPTEQNLLAAVARRFYLDDASKVAIAKEFDLSRFKVARMLERARDLGIVTITLHESTGIHAELSSRVAAHLGLNEAIVVEAAGDEQAIRSSVGKAAAALLSETLRDGETLGLAWGRTLTAMSASLTSLPRVSIVQLTGTVGSDFSESPVEVVQRASVQSAGTAHAIFAPLLVEDAAMAAALRRQPDVEEAMRRYDDITTAVVAIGSWDPPSSQLRAAMPENERAELRRDGVQAEVTGTLLDADGRLCRTDVMDRMLTISAQKLARIPRVIAAAGGVTKASAVVAVARSGLITSLVSDRSLAEAVLQFERVDQTTFRRGGSP